MAPAPLRMRTSLRPLPASPDAGAPVYFYDFQHPPQCLKDTRPAFVKADHTDEIRFVFGGAFLKGDIVMFGKKQAFGGFGSCRDWSLGCAGETT